MSDFDPWALPQQPFHFVLQFSLLPLDGPDALRVLHGQTTQDLQSARDGEVLDTCCVTATARMVALATVRVRDDGADLIVTAGDAQAVHQALERVLFPADQVSLGMPQLLHWHGLVQSDGAKDAAGWGLPGRHWLLDPQQSLPEALTALEPLKADQQEWLRLRQGIPAAGAELSDAFNPLELGLRQRVSFDKGCYLGQETLAKLNSRDGVKQQLRRFWAPNGVEAPNAGETLCDDSGERAALVTSVQGEGGLLLLRRRCWDHASIAGLELSLPDAALFDNH